MLNLTVNTDLSWASEDWNTIFVLIMLVYFFVSLVIIKVTDEKIDKKIGPTMLTVGTIIVFVGMSICFVQVTKKENIAENDYEVLRSTLLLDNVDNANINVKQQNDHKFIIKQYGMKNLISTIHGKKVVTMPATTTGKAYLRVIDYMKSQRKKSIQLT